MMLTTLRTRLASILHARAIRRIRRAVPILERAEAAHPDVLHRCYNLLESEPPERNSPAAWLLMSGREEAVAACLHQTLVNYLRNRAQPTLLRAREVHDDFVAAPLPEKWRRLLADHGFKLSAIGCMMSLWRLAWREWAAGIRMFIRLTGPARGLTQPPEQPYAVLAYSQHGRYFAPAEARRDGRGVDYLSWYNQWKDRAPDVGHVWIHASGAKDLGADCNFVDWPLPAMPWTFRKALFFGRAGLAAALALTGMIVGRWSAGLMLREAVLWHYARALPDEMLAREYLFDAAHWMVRPLWTHAVEDAGARIVMVAYGVNDLYFDPATGPDLEKITGAGVMNWPLWVVMSEDQARIRLAAHKHPFKWLLTDRIDRIDDGLPIPQRGSRPRVAIFDVVPVRAVNRAVTGALPMYFRWDVCVGFLGDIAEAGDATGFEPVLKSKKDRRSAEDKRYTRLKEALAANGELATISPWTAATRVIESCDIAISLPFSSTAIIAARMGKPSVFYDPTGLLAARCPRLHGVDVISGKEALVAWMRLQRIDP